MKDTRQALLNSACEVFSEKGYEDANVADICGRADANIASINYHFGSKKNLYVEVLRYALGVAEQAYPLMSDAFAALAPEERLAAFIQAQFERVYCDGLAGCFDRLIVHEVSRPTFAHDELFGSIMKPRREYLRSLFRELLPAGTGESHLRICVHNVVSLFAFHNLTRTRRAHHSKVHGAAAPAPKELAHFATAFALGGVRAISKEIADGHHASVGTQKGQKACR